MIKKLLFLLFMFAGISQTGLAQTDTLRTLPYVCQADSFPVTLSGIHPSGGYSLDSVVNAYRNDSLLLKYYFSVTFGATILTPFQVTFKFPTPQAGNYTIHAKRYVNNGINYAASTAHINVCMGINGLAKNNWQNLKVYPNPTNNHLFLKHLSGNEILTLSDLTGKILI